MKNFQLIILLLLHLIWSGCSSPNSNKELNFDYIGGTLQPFPPYLSELGFEEPDGQASISVFVTKGTELLSRGVKVSASDEFTMLGSLEMITDGHLGFAEGEFVGLSDGLQWVQIDLGEISMVNTIALWRKSVPTAKVYKDVIILVSKNEDFSSYITLFNNDKDNSSGFGFGKDDEYVEWYLPTVFEIDNVEARYFRFYSNGSYFYSQNDYVEIEIYGERL